MANLIGQFVFCLSAMGHPTWKRLHKADSPNDPPSKHRVFVVQVTAWPKCDKTGGQREDKAAVTKLYTHPDPLLTSWYLFVLGTIGAATAKCQLLLHRLHNYKLYCAKSIRLWMSHDCHMTMLLTTVTCLCLAHYWPCCGGHMIVTWPCYSQLWLVCVWPAIGHAEDASPLVSEVGLELILKGFSPCRGPALTSTSGVSPLYLKLETQWHHWPSTDAVWVSCIPTYLPWNSWWIGEILQGETGRKRGGVREGRGGEGERGRRETAAPDSCLWCISLLYLIHSKVKSLPHAGTAPHPTPHPPVPL